MLNDLLERWRPCAPCVYGELRYNRPSRTRKYPAYMATWHSGDKVCARKTRVHIDLYRLRQAETASSLDPAEYEDIPDKLDFALWQNSTDSRVASFLRREATHAWFASDLLLKNETANDWRFDAVKEPLYSPGIIHSVYLPKRFVRSYVCASPMTILVYRDLHAQPLGDRRKSA